MRTKGFLNFEKNGSFKLIASSLLFLSASLFVSLNLDIDFTKDYKQIFLTEDIRTIKAKPRYGTLDWGILLDEIYFENKINNEK